MIHLCCYMNGSNIQIAVEPGSTYLPVKNIYQGYPSTVQREKYNKVGLWTQTWLILVHPQVLKVDLVTRQLDEIYKKGYPCYSKLNSKEIHLSSPILWSPNQSIRRNCDLTLTINSLPGTLYTMIERSRTRLKHLMTSICSTLQKCVRIKLIGSDSHPMLLLYYNNNKFTYSMRLQKMHLPTQMRLQKPSQAVLLLLLDRILVVSESLSESSSSEASSVS
jgi:hypothetical protein